MMVVMAASNPVPSSATSGFFQALPKVPPQYNSRTRAEGRASDVGDDDPILKRVLSLYLPVPILPAVDSSLHDFARTCLAPATLQSMIDAETNQPTLHPLTTFGEQNKLSPLRTSEGWRQLKKIQTRAGTVALGYGNLPGQFDAKRNARIHQFATCHLWAGSAALVTCPAAMTDGAAFLLGKHIRDVDGDQPGRAAVLTDALRRLTTFDPADAWTSGQWMTERSGGSDVSQTETVARRLSVQDLAADATAFSSSEDGVGMPLGPWTVDGFKWFSSATDADMVVLLARTAKGISAFYAPMRRKCGMESIMNGVRISRLKNKLGTKALPTAELELTGMRAWLIGAEGKGVKEISAILNLTRLWTASGAVGYWSRGLAIARAYARVRKVKASLLIDNKSHVAWMAEETVKYRASAHLAFLGVALLSVAEQGPGVADATRAQRILPESKSEAELLLRILTPVMKAQCSLASISGLRECMESLGGVGYCENNEDGGVLNIARLFRDANVNAIWEGTTNVLAEDLLRALKGKTGSESTAALDKYIKGLIQSCRSQYSEDCRVVLDRWQEFLDAIEQTGTEELHYRGRALLRQLELVLCACLLMYDASSDGDRVATAVSRRWLAMNFSDASGWKVQESAWLEDAAMDREIFIGKGNSAELQARM